MKVLLMPNFEKDHAAECTIRVCEKLLELSAEVYMRERHRRYVNLAGIHYGAAEEWLSVCDVILVIGGDGSIIHSAKWALDTGKPILGINAGRLGFLAGVEPTKLDELKNLIEGHYQKEERMLLEILTETEGEIHHYFALNDVVLSRGILASMIELDVSCSGHQVISYRSDGLIFATPTGSTAYTLSAGGPIIDPLMDTIAMTPLSPHSLFDRTILFSAEKELEVRRSPSFYGEMMMILDGEEVVSLGQKARIMIRRAEKKATLLNVNGKPFYEVLNEKFVTRGMNSADHTIEGIK